MAGTEVKGGVEKRKKALRSKGKEERSQEDVAKKATGNGIAPRRAVDPRTEQPG